MRVMVPACTDSRGDGTEGWAILKGIHNPPEVVAFCWSRENAELVYNALGKQEKGGVWIAPAFLTEDDR